MMKHFILAISMVLPCIHMIAQTTSTGINTLNPDASSILDVSATDKGVLLPRVALTGETDTSTIIAPAEGLTVFVPDGSGLSEGYYYYNGTRWVGLLSGEVSTGDGLRVNGGALEVNIGDGLRFDAAGALEVGNIRPLKFVINIGSSSETYTLNENDYTVILSGNSFNIELPTPNTDNQGRIYHIVNLSNNPANFIGSNVRGFTLSEVLRTIPANSSLTIQSTGNWWQIIGDRPVNPGRGLEIALGELKARIGSGLIFDEERRIAVSNIKPINSVGSRLGTPVRLTLDHTHHTVVITNEAAVILFPEAAEHEGRVYRLVNKTSTPRDIGPNLAGFDGIQISTIPRHSSMEFQSDGITWKRID
ncbi:hypothetical protein [Flagellimonas onchidii]|uniref:hypothetical protein n=1 Tax=Flagellimonas onchidii TaxID=2562684 RepID=UPI0010A65A0C|nr:hypothetical protein [Allomuricauda onchidii]